MSEYLENTETFIAKRSAVPRGLTNVQRLKVDIEQKRKYQEKADAKQKIVLLPARLGIEEYRQRQTKVASLCEYHKVVDVDDSTIEVHFKCVSRCIVEDLSLSGASYLANVKLLPEETIGGDDDVVTFTARRLVGEIQGRFRDYLTLDPSVRIAQIENVKAPRSIDHLIENVIIGAKIRYDTTAAHGLLSELYPIKRLHILGSALETRIFEQEADKGRDLVAHYRDRLDNLVVNAEVKKRIYLELSRLKSLRRDSSEYGNVMDWLDRVLAFPWSITTEDTNDLEAARGILNSGHYGLEKLKQRILDSIAIQKYTNKQPPQILCLYGPPGVGKSTIAKSIAAALGREYAAISLGGANKSEDIMGMKRFFVGAKSGKIVEAITQAGSKNCVLLLDEIDKISTNKNRGDPSSALLSVLDRNQNDAFKDDYFDIPVDLSNVFFITTANDLSTITKPLLNRLEIVTLDGYSLNEKIHITTNYLIKKVSAEFGLDENIISLSPDTVSKVIEQHTFESGVRQLENVIREIIRRHIAYRSSSNFSLESVELSIDDINKMIESPYEEEPNLAGENEIGVVNKLSVTNGNIGSVSRLEVVVTASGKGEQIVSDNIIGTALSTLKTVAGLLRYRASDWQIPRELFSDYDIYIHSPVEERRHSGSSGGVADVVCILSAIKNMPVPHKIAFTGAITLKGRILRIGGVKAKVLAAQRQKIKTVVLPLANKKDIDELSPDVVGDMEFKYFDDITDVNNYVFGVYANL